MADAAPTQTRIIRSVYLAHLLRAQPSRRQSSLRAKALLL